jgi:hypothetical protein
VDIIRELDENEENEIDDDLYDNGSRNERGKSKRKEKKRNNASLLSPGKRVNVLETLENQSKQNKHSDLFDDDADDENSPKIVKKRTILIDSDDDHSDNNDEKKELENDVEMRLVLNDSESEDKENSIISRRQARIIESDDEDQILSSLNI